MDAHRATAQDMASSSVDRGPVAAPKQADRPSVVGPKYRLRTLASLDGRTLGARRARQLAAEFIAQLGSNVTATQRRAAEHAAMLIAISEDLATRQLAGEPISLDGLIRAQGAARRAIRDLGLPGRPSAPGSPQPLGPLRTKFGEQVHG